MPFFPPSDRPTRRRDGSLRLSLRRSRIGRRGLAFDPLESRVVMSTATIRVAEYNIAADINGVTTPLPGLYQILEGIGEEKVQGDVQPIDILGLEETTSNSTTVAPIVTNLNSYYNGAAVYAQSSYQATQDGTDTDGNGPNAMVYNTSTLKLLASVGVGTPEGSTNGEYRQVVRYEFQPVGDTGTTGIFYVYVSHEKSGSGTTNDNLRNEESQIIRNDEAANLPSTASVIYMGDFNLDASTDPSYVTLTAAKSPSGVSQGEGYDPIADPGAWNTAAFKGVQTDNSADLELRTDHQIITQNVLNDTTGQLGYIAGSYHAFGNNGSTPENGSTSASTNTAFNSDLVQDGGTFVPASTLYADLTTASDHLSVVADYTVPTSSATGTPMIGSFTASPASVPVGTSTTLTASSVTETGGSGTITGVNFYRESNGTTGLQIGSDTLVGAGTQSGTSWSIATSTTGFTAGTYTYYAVATDSNGTSSAVSSTTLTVTSSSSTPITGVVVAWDTDNQTSYGTQGLAAKTVATGATNSLGLTRGSGVTTSGTAAANAWGGNGWASTSSAGISGNEFATFGFTISSGYTTSLASIALNYRRSSTGPSSGYWQYQLNGGSWTLIGDESSEFSSTSSSGAAITPISLTSITALQSLAAGSVVNFRVVPYGATSSSGTWYVYDGGNNTSDLVVNASSSPMAVVGQSSGASGSSSPSYVGLVFVGPDQMPVDASLSPAVKKARATPFPTWLN